MTNILVATPTYTNQVHINYFVTALDIKNSGIQADFDFLSESLISRARDELISEFYRYKFYTHLLFLDSDTGIEEGGFKKLIERNVDVVGAPVRIKRHDIKIYAAVRENDIYIMDKDLNGNLVEVDFLGTGCMLLSRKAVESLVHDAIEHGKFFKNRIGSYDYFIFGTGVDKNKIYLSEDWYLCRKLKELGYKIYLDTSIKTSHMGQAKY
ncbi:MAG: hypothetical protein FIB08_03655 [Candidatus Methanoperedens sp.]|nr:hypothetical protein [Candidatus Methanoperedens sp.]